MLTRDQFREAVFARDKHRCVSCGVKDVKLDAHHLIERRLWPDGGYYLDNGVTVCEPCHLRCESTEVPVATLRQMAGITNIVLPPGWEPDDYDKWGNIVFGPYRAPGPLYNDPAAQKALAMLSSPVQWLNHIKYPRTPHLPWSPGVTDDDKILHDINVFNNQEVVITEKLDGECTTLYNNGLHARSLDYKPHPSRTWVTAMWASIRYDIPNGFRICGENLYAKHSIAYDSLPSFFLVFNIWDRFRCLSWDETTEWCSLLGLEPVPVLWRGIYHETYIRRMLLDPTKQEGYVVRLAQSFNLSEFQTSVAKFVRPNHVTTDSHWMNSATQPNRLKV